MTGGGAPLRRIAVLGHPDYPGLRPALKTVRGFTERHDKIGRAHV